MLVTFGAMCDLATPIGIKKPFYLRGKKIEYNKIRFDFKENQAITYSKV